MCGSIAGLGSGLTEGLFITPFERVKILLQNSKGSLKGQFLVVYLLENGKVRDLRNLLFRDTIRFHANAASYQYTWIW